MFDFLAFLQKLYTYRHREFCRRFITLTLLLIVSAIFATLRTFGAIPMFSFLPWFVIIWMVLLSAAFFGAVLCWPGERRKAEQIRQSVASMALEPAQALLDKLSNTWISSPAFAVHCKVHQTTLYRVTGDTAAALRELNELADRILLQSEQNRVSVQRAHLFLEDGNRRCRKGAAAYQTGYRERIRSFWIRVGAKHGGAGF